MKNEPQKQFKNIDKIKEPMFLKIIDQDGKIVCIKIEEIRTMYHATKGYRPIFVIETTKQTFMFDVTMAPKIIKIFEMVNLTIEVECSEGNTHSRNFT